MNCRSGDLALVIKGRLSGLICEVIKAGQMPCGEFGWHVRFRDPQKSDTGIMQTEGVMRDDCLRPLRPEDSEPVEQRETVSA